jgi:pyruvate dehydrogenase E2 component (dihydrolipoamide acetyltransferase)
MATDTAIEVVMPQMGVSVSEGTITKWLKQEGEEIAADEPLLEISTDKVDTEVPSPGTGTLQQILVQEGETVDVGTKLAVIGSGAAAAPPAEETPPPEPATQPAADASAAAATCRRRRQLPRSRPRRRHLLRARTAAATPTAMDPASSRRWWRG